MPPTRKDSSIVKQNLNVNQRASSSKEHVFTGPTSIIRGKACHQCRQRKTGCDGVRPVCGRCLQRGVKNCEFDNPEDWGKMRQLTHCVEVLTAELAVVQQEIDILKQALEERNNASQIMMTQDEDQPITPPDASLLEEQNNPCQNMMTQDEDQPITPPDALFLKLTYNQPSMRPSAAISGRPHESPEFTTMSLTWDPQIPVYQYSKLDPENYSLPPSFQNMDYADDEDVPMVDLDSIIYLDRLDPT